MPEKIRPQCPNCFEYSVINQESIDRDDVDIVGDWRPVICIKCGYKFFAHRLYCGGLWEK